MTSRGRLLNESRSISSVIAARALRIVDIARRNCLSASASRFSAAYTIASCASASQRVSGLSDSAATVATALRAAA